ncbi:hypothetical protein Q5752_004366 [Cryptotrichosporon argae]
MAAPYPYAYPVPNSHLIATLGLQPHFEGGYFAQTVFVAAAGAAAGPGARVLDDAAPDPPAPGAGPAPAATQIYYLLTPDSYRGKMHMNLHATFHVHHAGRALYTLIRPPTSPADAPEIRRIIVGPNVGDGEVLQLFVPGGWWKASEIPEEDLLLLSAAPEGGEAAPAERRERIGCLISEVVVPGWTRDQHQFIDEDKLKAMWNGTSGWEQYLKYLAPPEGLEYPEK